MSEPQNPPAVAPPVSTFAGPVAELIAQRMLTPPSRPGLLAMLDHFEILRILGGGGMGIVLLARDSRTGTDAAVKLIRSDLVTNQQVVHRFLKEAGHLKKLRHTNIVPVEEVSERPEAPYFVMPYFEKGSLANRMKPEQPLDAETVLDIATQVAEGLSFAHRSGIIHRDLKPANILVGSGGRICLGDFGLARTFFNDSIVDVERQQLEGTAPYMSPAVAAGDAEDTRCDIYSFGALLYEMLTGHAPYKGRSTKEILNKIIAGPPQPILSFNPAADRRLVAVAEHAMARELRNRYADMRDVIQDLQQIKDGKRPDGLHKTSPGLLAKILMWTIIGIVAFFVAVLLIKWSFEPGKPAPIAKPLPPQPVAPAPVQPPVATPAPAPPPAPVTILAGDPGTKGFANGPGAVAEFHLPNNIAVDHLGNIYVADTANDIIRKIAPDGTVSTLAGMAKDRGSVNGKGSKARFFAPFGVAVEANGDVIVADTGNNTIRKITPDGMVSTIAGVAGKPGYADGVGAAARFRNPWGVAVDGNDGDIIVADMSNETIRHIATNGAVVTLAGQPGQMGNADGFGNDARFDNPFAVAVDSAGNIYVSDSANDEIRRITHRVVTTLAGQSGSPGNADGSGSAARFWDPQGLAVDSAGNVYVADTGNNLIREITPMGAVTTLPQTAAANVHLNSPGGVAVDDKGNVYVADTNNHCIRKIASAK